MAQTRASERGASAGAMSQTQLAMLLMVAAMLMLPGIDAIAKWLSGSVSAGQVSWSRFFFQALFTLPFALRVDLAVPAREIGVHALRGSLIATATVLFFSSLRVLPLADAISIFFISPLILTLLSATLLGERIGWRRLSAVLAGFIGALVVVRPAFESFGATALLPVVAAVAFACYLLLTRRLAPRDDPIRMQFYAGVFGCLSMSLVLLIGEAYAIRDADPIWPGAAQWGLLLSLGLVATIGHLLVVHAFKRAQAGALAPFQYLEIVGATLYGLLLFGDFPDLMTWFGIAIIVASGLYVFHRERMHAPGLTAAP